MTSVESDSRGSGGQDYTVRAQHYSIEVQSLDLWKRHLSVRLVVELHVAQQLEPVGFYLYDELSVDLVEVDGRQVSF